MKSERFKFSSEVAEALAGGRPVVALESTVIAQGLPWPENLGTARAAEAAVRSAGATPATIAVKGGVIHVGLSDSECTELARAALALLDSPPLRDAPNDPRLQPPTAIHPGVAKANRRDLSGVIARGQDAATTVSATLWLARRSGLAPYVMATGGLGGVHRDAAMILDVSTDLDELARADGALLVCSGFKSILDVPATLEALETRGVPVVGYRTGELPGFLTRTTGLPLDQRVDSPAEAAELAHTHRDLALPGAIVLVQPVPQALAMDRHLHRTAIDAALEQAKLRNIRGKQLTPFLLESIRQQSGGLSLAANCALLIANARLAGEIAVAICRSETSHR
jgi:pseudouridine-5'-phosphate glycosidase